MHEIQIQAVNDPNNTELENGVNSDSNNNNSSNSSSEETQGVTRTSTSNIELNIQATSQQASSTEAVSTNNRLENISSVPDDDGGGQSSGRELDTRITDGKDTTGGGGSLSEETCQQLRSTALVREDLILMQ